VKAPAAAAGTSTAQKQMGSRHPGPISASSTLSARREAARLAALGTAKKRIGENISSGLTSLKDVKLYYRQLNISPTSDFLDAQKDKQVTALLNEAKRSLVMKHHPDYVRSPEEKVKKEAETIAILLAFSKVKDGE
jgi:hypothetical protein